MIDPDVVRSELASAGEELVDNAVALPGAAVMAGAHLVVDAAEAGMETAGEVSGVAGVAIAGELERWAGGKRSHVWYVHLIALNSRYSSHLNPSDNKEG